MGVRGRGRGSIRWGNETACAASKAEAFMKTGGGSVDHISESMRSHSGSGGQRSQGPMDPMRFLLRRNGEPWKGEPGTVRSVL